MKRTFQTIVIGASMAVGISAIATAPARATSFTFNNPNEIKTYTGGSNGTFIANDTAAAARALNDHNVTSNVELWYSDENPTANVGFTASKGNYSATVSSVTASDWNNFGSQWLGDLLSTYTPFQSVWNGFSASTKSLITSYFPSLGMGDPNIGSFQFGENGGVELKLIGHLDVKTRLSQTLTGTLNSTWNTIKSQSGLSSTTPLPTLTQVNGQLSQLQTSLTTVTNSITALQSQLARTTNVALRTSLNAQITTATNTKTTLTTQITGLTSLKDLLSLQVTLNGYQGEIGASEIAKVVTGGQTHYAYSFNPTASGITASDDGVSYSAIYTWRTAGFVAVTPHVPEPSVMFGLLGVAGVFAVKRKFKKASV